MNLGGIAALAGGIAGGIGDGLLQKHQEELEQKVRQTQARTAALANPNLTVDEHNAIQDLVSADLLTTALKGRKPPQQAKGGKGQQAPAPDPHTQAWSVIGGLRGVQNKASSQTPQTEQVPTPGTSTPPFPKLGQQGNPAVPTSTSAMPSRQTWGEKQQQDKMAADLAENKAKLGQEGEEKLTELKQSFAERKREGEDLGLKGAELTNFIADKNVSPRAGSFKTQARGITGSSIQDQSTDAFGKPIDPKQTYDRVETGDGLVYMPGKAATARAPSLLSLIEQANAGDPKAAAAVKTYETIQTRIREGYAAGRAKFQLVNVSTPDGSIKTLPLLEAANRINSGEPLTMVGTAPFSAASNVQIVASESYPAIQGVRDFSNVFDNAEDRAILARLFSPSAQTTIGNLLNQNLRKGLSPDGQKLAVRMGRLMETMGRVRQQMGLPQTDASTELSMNLVGAGQIPSSEYANYALDQIKGMVDNAISIPAYQGIGGGGAGRTKLPDVPKTGQGAAFKPPADAPPAPKEDGHLLKKGGQVIAVSKGGQWAAPPTQ